MFIDLSFFNLDSATVIFDSLKYPLLRYLSHSIYIFQCNLNKVSDIGAITVQFDKPEQVLDLIIEAIEGAGFTPGKDFSIVIDCAADEVVDMVNFIFLLHNMDFSNFYDYDLIRNKRECI